jgi:heme/copper-type cytochrome/quinol oxidase subunit 2
VHFWITSKDVVHGFFIPRANVNVMVLPGQIAHVEARFDRPGEYPIICHEYCGIAHHAMAGKVMWSREPRRPAIRAAHRRAPAGGNVALLGGIVTGLLQGLEHAGFEFPASEYFLQSYYHSVSLHGVLNVLVWTTFFIAGFLPFISARAYAMPLRSPRLGWVTFWLMLAGLVIAAVPLAGNAATVMFTFYAPLKAHWAFYVGLTLVVVGTWLITLRLALSQRDWRAGHPGARTPLAAFMSLVTMAMWTLASVGLAASMLLMLIPWSLGSSRNGPAAHPHLFWLTGHPIVYFGCSPPTSPGTPCPARRAAGSSAIPWRAAPSCSSSSSPRHSACTTR